MVFDFSGLARKPCPGVITQLSQEELLLLLVLDRTIARDINRAEIMARETIIQEWKKLGMKAQAFIVKY